MGLVATTSPPPLLAATPPLLLPPLFKPYTLDGAFDAFYLGRCYPQPTQQQWHNNGGTPSSPPPLPVPNRNLYASQLEQHPAPYGGPSLTPGLHHIHNAKPTLPPPLSPPRPSFFPPASIPPEFSRMSQQGQVRMRI